MRISLLYILIILTTFQTNVFSQSNEHIIELGFKSFNEEKYFEAIDFFSKVIYPTLNNDNEEYYPYEFRVDNEKIERNENAVIIPPTHPSENQIIAMHKMAECYQAINDYLSAELWFEEAVRYPLDEFPYTRYFYAISLMKNNKYDSAATTFEKFTLNDVVEKENLFHKKALAQIKSCHYASDPFNTNNIYNIEQVDSVVNFGVSSYAMQYVSPSHLIFSSTPKAIDILNVSNEFIKNFYSIYLIKINADGTYQSPEKLPFAINDANRHQGSMTMSSDGNQIFFTRSHPLFKNQTAIYYSKKSFNSWQSPQMMNDAINVEGFRALDPCMTRDGKKLYFASNMPGGEGGMDIWVADIDENGIASNSINLGFNVNTEYDETSPFYHEATKALYFSSEGGIGFGGKDIFISKWNFNNDWYKKSKNIGAPINTTKDETHFIIDNKLENGYLTSDRDVCRNCVENKTSIDFCNKIYEVKKALLNFVIEGYVFDAETNLPIPRAEVEFKDVSYSRGSIGIVTDENGYYKQVIEHEVDYFLKASKIDYFADQGIVSTVDLSESESFTKNFYLKPIPKGEITIEGIEYDFNKATLRPESIVILDKLVEFLNLNDNLSVEIRSHTDYRGSVPYNFKLSDARAKSVVDYLISQGIEMNRLQPKGYGESEPAEIFIEPANEDVEGEIIALTKSYIDALATEEEKEEAHQRNRRTAFKVLGQ